MGVAAQNWPEVRPEARPGSRWWWLGSAVDKDNLNYNLKEYGKAGLGSLEVTPIYGVKGNESHNIRFLSPEWMEMFRYTQEVGKMNGIDIDMNTGTDGLSEVLRFLFHKLQQKLFLNVMR